MNNDEELSYKLKYILNELGINKTHYLIIKQLSKEWQKKNTRYLTLGIFLFLL